ncbi:pseudaminic acid cytidylyltransferase [Alteromonas macleodii]|uniref:pseudaminic acid cytidylyltransferase n=1 Tax=Alteromonas macleodii TaxID=28108 RepID=UPI00066D96CC|nr:pseudaminic acid cytidylyltransferase [Alteromonas macleodii]CAI3941004.1 N-acylneuraminate cytidylyltransferase [Alteromonas macleodii]VTP51051.1 N-acylneuraminate cytidylyltransferase [Alteromonas macleodii]|tara:strand:+ start:560 stop:1246 length:687 start_codon:yes stop_codon:yes gene_type:complete
MNVAIIPARSGSKRITKKNIKMFAGKPIIAYSIENALSCKSIDSVYVSTDSEEISEIAKSYGATVAFNRPKSLALDTTPTMPVVSHAIKEITQIHPIENVCLLYATAPLINSIDIDNAYQQWQQTTKDYIFSVVSYSYPIQRALYKNHNNEIDMVFPDNIVKRSQDFEHVFHDAGTFYWGTQAAFSYQKPVFSSSSDIYELSRWKAQDIDTVEDWEFAEKLYQVNLLD